MIQEVSDAVGQVNVSEIERNDHEEDTSHSFSTRKPEQVLKKSSRDDNVGDRFANFQVACATVPSFDSSIPTLVDVEKKGSPVGMTKRSTCSVGVESCKESVLFTPTSFASNVADKSKRKVSIGGALKYSYVQHFNSDSSHEVFDVCKTVVKGASPLNHKIGNDVDFDLEYEYNLWMDKGLRLHNKRKLYSVNSNDIRPPFDFVVDSISEKMWWFDLQTVGRELSSSHIDVIFYYIRKKIRYGDVRKPKCTTTDNTFDQHLNQAFRLCKKKGKLILPPINSNHPICASILGHVICCNTSWTRVDDVLLPIYIKKLSHWVLGRFSLTERIFYVYDSMGGKLHRKQVCKYLEPYTLLLPYFLNAVPIYDCRPDIDRKSGLFPSRDTCDPLDVQFVEGLPIQENSDCGLFISAFAEYYIQNDDIPNSLNVERHRMRYCVLLYHHGRHKQEADVISDDELVKKNKGFSVGLKDVDKRKAIVIDS